MRGVLYGVAAYLIWGLFPLYWPLLEPASAVEILSHRVLWTLIVVAVLLWSPLLGASGLAAVRGLTARQLRLLSIAAALICLNWVTYIYGVNAGLVVETSLGYFINPLVSVALGVVVLRERLRPLQWLAVGLALVAVLALTVDYGRPPWVALTLALSFGVYGFLRKRADVGPVDSLAVETALIALPAAAFLAVLAATGDGTFTSEGPGHAALLLSSGVVTAIPLLFFGAAAIRVRLSTLGLLQYLAPVLQFLIGVFVYDEDMPASRLAGFALVWAALVLLTVDAVRTMRNRDPALVGAVA